MRKFIDINFDSRIGTALINFFECHNQHVFSTYETPIATKYYSRLRSSFLRQNHNCHYIARKTGEINSRFSLIFDPEEDAMIFIIKWST